MESIYNYFFPQNPPPQPMRVVFGKWASQLDFLDTRYNGLATKLIRFAQEAGSDPYNRHFEMEQLVDFAITRGITAGTADYIYRHYVYYLIGQVEGNSFNVDREEINCLYNDFILVPENVTVIRDLLDN